MAFDYQFFPLKDSGKTNPHLKTLYTVMGRVPRPTQFTDTQGISRTDSTDSDNHQDVTTMDTESGQAGGVTDELDTLDDSSDDELVQDVLDEMKETI
jgi:hypothetical protein